MAVDFFLRLCIESEVGAGNFCGIFEDFEFDSIQLSSLVLQYQGGFLEVLSSNLNLNGTIDDTKFARAFFILFKIENFDEIFSTIAQKSQKSNFFAF